MKEENKTKNTKTEVKKEHTPKKDKKLEEIEKLKQEVAEEKDKRMRIQAEMLNIKKRSDDALAMYRKYANEDILKSLLPIVDNFERALSMENEENQEASHRRREHQRIGDPRFAGKETKPSFLHKGASCSSAESDDRRIRRPFSSKIKARLQSGRNA